MPHRTTQREDGNSEELLAGFYGLYLKLVGGLAADEAALLVIERYPRTKSKLEPLLTSASQEQREGAA